MKKVLWIFSLFILASCTGMPELVKPVQKFELDRYLGKWYEIARLDHSFERGLSQVSAEYSLKDDGGVKVLNRGFSKEEDKWNEAEGKAYFVDKTNATCFNPSRLAMLAPFQILFPFISKPTKF